MWARLLVHITGIKRLSPQLKWGAKHDGGHVMMNENRELGPFFQRKGKHGISPS